ncbi:MAG TPA: glycosyl hydrolase family 65 protein [Clostridia bacterium]
MAKTACRYFKGDGWTIEEIGYDAEKNAVSESIFSLCNEYTGVRGIIEEGVSAKSLIGTYFNGIYEYAKDITPIHYKGIVQRTHFMINSVNYLYTEIYADGLKLDIAKCNISDFKRSLNLKNGELIRSFIWKTHKGNLEVSFRRFLSMIDCRFGFQKIHIKSIDFEGEIQIISGLDFNILHFSKENFWQHESCRIEKDHVFLCASTPTTNQRIMSSFGLKVQNNCLENQRTDIKESKFAAKKLMFQLEKNQYIDIEKNICNIAEKQKTSKDLLSEAQTALNNSCDYMQSLKDNQNHWSEFWSKSDIEIKGDLNNQQGIRFCLFNLHQTLHGLDRTNNIGAKGLTGEAYSGHTFWDTETFCLPFYLFNDLAAAKNLLLYRYKTLPQAKSRAKELDCLGACYPIATLNGYEACTLWQHASLQFQPSTGVAYGIMHYFKISKDTEFLYNQGIEMLLEISRFLITRGQWNADGSRFGYYGVMGPDEFQMMVNHNCYTNFMAKKTLEYTLQVLDEINQKNYQRFLNLEVSENEINTFTKCADSMYIPYDNESMIFEQHAGYFDLPHVDVDSIPIEDFPLYYHWSYDRIYRNDMIKQPDVLMFMFLFYSDFSLKQLKANYDFYKPRTIHESSLSPSIHSILAAALDYEQDAIKFFEFATRMDLDDFNRNTLEGLHMTSIAAAWMNIVYGYGGLRSDSNKITICPKIPEIWSQYSFKINFNNKNYKITVNHNEAFVDDGNSAVRIPVGKTYTIY